MNKEQFDFFSKYIEKEIGIVYSEENRFQLQARLNDIMKFYSLSTFDDLYHKAKDGISSTFKQLLLDIATNNETLFFRDQKVFQGLAKFVLPELISSLPPGETLKIWSAACSFGQEPYSIAIALMELKKKMFVPNFQIVATDISSIALERANSARYSQLEVQRGLPIHLLIQYFTKDPDDYWTLKPEVRSSVRLQIKNLKDSFTDLGNFHLIFCRNVLIYQKLDNKIDIIHRLEKQLTQKGRLLLGSAESMIGISDRFSQVIREGMIMYQSKSNS
ncbi:MAG: protein-glutamate O-methyltransferase CheR [Bdellovibrionia bacterium]